MVRLILDGRWCDTKIHREVAVGLVHTGPADVEMFATFAIP